MKVFKEYFNEETQKYMTKIILATKIAESSITIDGVTVVIDTGLAKEASYDPVRQITSIDTEFISKAQAT
jgi:ATP-dependent helicase HrpB